LEADKDDEPHYLQLFKCSLDDEMAEERVAGYMIREGADTFYHPQFAQQYGEQFIVYSKNKSLDQTLYNNLEKAVTAIEEQEA